MIHHSFFYIKKPLEFIQKLLKHKQTYYPFSRHPGKFKVIEARPLLIE